MLRAQLLPMVSLATLTFALNLVGCDSKDIPSTSAQPVSPPLAATEAPAPSPAPGSAPNPPSAQFGSAPPMPELSSQQARDYATATSPLFEMGGDAAALVECGIRTEDWSGQLTDRINEVVLRLPTAQISRDDLAAIDKWNHQIEVSAHNILVGKPYLRNCPNVARSHIVDQLDRAVSDGIQ